MDEESVMEEQAEVVKKIHGERMDENEDKQAEWTDSGKLDKESVMKNQAEVVQEINDQRLDEIEDKDAVKTNSS